jgi:hypothetical protein
MKKSFIIIAGLLLSGSLAHAFTAKDTITHTMLRKLEYNRMVLAMDDCDACGCSASGGSLGFSSMLNNNFVGVRYFRQSYSSRDGIFANSPWIDENFNTVQIWARVPVTNRIQISALVPYHFNTRERITGDEHIEGLGDITVIGMYTVAQTIKDSAVYTHKLQLGGGVKAPTGKYDSSNNLGSVNPSFQIGTGSWDYLLAAEYVVQRKNLGLNTMVNYTFKSENQKQYQFGNQLNYGSMLFYLFDVNDIKLVPQAGIAGEVYKTNQQYGLDVPKTSGDILFSKFGLEAGKDRFSVGINAMLPLSQNLTGGNVEANYRCSVNLNYSL